MNTEVPILPELNNRKSIRAFQRRVIEREKIDALWAAARWAPSNANKQEWRYYAFLGRAVERLEPVLNRGNQWALHAPLVLAVTRDTTIENQTESRKYGSYDVALSVMSLVIEAEHQGLRAHQMAGFKEAEFRRVIGIPGHEQPVVMVAVGYEGDPVTLDERTREKERTRVRTRQPLDTMLKIIND